MANIYLGDIIIAGQIAQDIWKKSCSENLAVGKLRSDFFNTIRLSSNGISELAKVLDSAVEQRRYALRDNGNACDVTSLVEIIGDYKSTITQCKRLLDKSRPFFQRSGPFNQWRYNFTVQNDVERLTDRLNVFNSKLIFLLKPLEIDLLRRIYDEVASVKAIAIQLRGILIGELTPDAVRQLTTQPLQHTSTYLPIPPTIRQLFQDRWKVDGPENLEVDGVPLPDAADALALHLKDSTRLLPVDRNAPKQTPPVMQYVSLLKCVFILEQLEERYDFQDAESGSHWPGFIRHMRDETVTQCQRFVPTLHGDCDLARPTDVEVTFDDCDIWQKRSDAPLGPIIDERIGMMDELEDLRVPLATNRPYETTKMRALRGSKGRFKLLLISEDRTPGRATKTDVKQFTFNANTVKLIPLYADSSNKFGAEFMIQNDFDSMQLSFTQVKHALLFQQAVTGYKVYDKYSHGHVGINLFSSNPPTAKIRKGYIQLWIPKELKGTPVSVDSLKADLRPQPQTWKVQATPSQSSPITQRRPTFASPTESSPPPPLPARSTQRPSVGSASAHSASQPQPIGRRTSNATSPTFPTSSTSPRSGFFHMLGINRRDSAESTLINTQRPKLAKRDSVAASTHSSESLHTISNQTITMIDHGNGNPQGFLHTKPKRPMLVLFLYDVSTDRQDCGLSLLAVQIDDETAVNYDRCGCKASPDSCKEAALERRQGKLNLLAQHYPAAEVDDWDITALGSHKRKDLPDHADGLQRLTVMFPGVDGVEGPVLRRDFGGVPCRCPAFGRATGEQWHRCLTARPTHQGRFGSVRDDGRVALRNWSRAREERDDIVLA